MNKPNVGTVAGVPLLDVVRSNEPLRQEILEAISEILETGRFVGGPACQQFEAAMAQDCNAKHAVGCASGSDALLLALMAMEIGPGDEVIVPSFTFFATASAVWRLGAKPVFAEIDPDTFNICPKSIAGLINKQTRAIIPVHLFGQSADMNTIVSLANEAGLYVIEDAAQAIGASCEQQPVGSIGHIGCFSFYPTKNLGGIGDGGICTTNDDQLAEKLRLMANHGMSPRYLHQKVGVNSRLDAIQAAALTIKLKKLSTWSSQRRENAGRYRQLFTEYALTDRVDLPKHVTRGQHVWNQYTIRVADRETRDFVRAQLAEANIGSEIYYPIPLHLQQCFASLGYQHGSLPETEKAAAQVLSLPIFPGLTGDEQQQVVAAIYDAIGARTSRRAA